MNILMIISLLALLYFLNRLFKQFMRHRIEQKGIDYQTEAKRELLRKLNSLHAFDPNGYSGETKTTIEKLQADIDATMSLVMDASSSLSFEEMEEKVDLVVSNATSFSDGLKRNIILWEQAEALINEKLSFATSFFQSSTFLPSDMSFDLNKLNGYSLDIRETRRTNPLSSPDEYIRFATEVDAKLQQFISLYKETTAIISSLSTLSFSKEKSQSILDMQQNLYFYLQTMKFDDAQKLIKELNQQIRIAQKK